MPIWMQAGLWGLLGASSLVIGAAVAYLVRLPPRITAGVMAFGCGVLISAVAFDLMEEAENTGGMPATASGFLAGAVGPWSESRRRSRRSPIRHDQLAALVGAHLDLALEPEAAGSLLDGRLHAPSF